MSRTFTKNIGIDELAGAIAYAFSQSREFDGETGPSGCKDAIDFLKQNRFRSGRITPDIDADLKKVQFDEENMEWETEEVDQDGRKVIGFHTLDNGLTFLGIQAGGDWESPLVYIIYYDGTKLRGYIPKDGNTWNTDISKAYGNGHECVPSGGEDSDDLGEQIDCDNAKKRFGVDDWRDANWDQDLILADIKNRILPSLGKFVQPKGLADIDGNELEERQEAQEKQAAVNAEAWRQRCSGMDSVKVVTMKAPGAVPVPSDKDGGQTLSQMIETVTLESQKFVEELERLKLMSISQESVAEAVLMRDQRLRAIVGKFCTIVEVLKASA